MVDKVKQATKTTTKRIETAYEVAALAAAIAAAVKVASEPRVNGFPFWQVVAGVILTGVVAKVFVLLSKEA